MSHSILDPSISDQQQMALDVLDWTSILGLWTFVSIMSFLILCWKRIYYVGYVVMFSQLHRPYQVFR